MAKKTKKLPRGNIKAVGNLKPGLRGVDGPPSRRVLVFQGSKTGPGTGYRLPVAYHAKEPYRYNVRPGFEEAALPLEGPPGSEWWNQPEYNKGRR